MAGTLSVAAIIAVVVILLLSVIPIMAGAAMVGAGRAGFGPSFVALIVSAVLHAFGGLVPIAGNIVAFVLAGIGFAWVLRTSVLKGLVIHFIQIVFWFVLGLVATLVFGVGMLGALAL